MGIAPQVQSFKNYISIFTPGCDTIELFIKIVDSRATGEGATEVNVAFSELVDQRKLLPFIHIFPWPAKIVEDLPARLAFHHEHVCAYEIAAGRLLQQFHC